MNPGRIELHIEELTFTGFSPGNPRVLADAFERELARLIAERGLTPAAEGTVKQERINAGSLRVPPNRNAGALGARIARSVYEGLKR